MVSRAALLNLLLLAVVVLAGCTTAPGTTTDSTTGTTTAGAPSACSASPAQTAGPYFVDGRADRADIRSDEGAGSSAAESSGYDEYIFDVPERLDLRASGDGGIQPGAFLHLSLTLSRLVDGKCAPLQGARVDLWHANATGVYSGFGSGVGHDFLRGYQTTDADGKVTFITIWPGWYPGRAVHMHLKVRTYESGKVASDFTSQLYFDDALNDQVLAGWPYAGRGAHMKNSEDGIYRSGGASLLVAVEPQEGGLWGTKQLIIA